MEAKQREKVIIQLIDQQTSQISEISHKFQEISNKIPL